MNEQPTTPERLAQAGHGLPPGANAWPAGHRIGAFEFRGVVAMRPTAIVYRGWDHGLEVPVALKEYMPAALARRGAYGDVGPAEPQRAEAFERGLRAFIAEGRRIARCDHPSLVRVLQLLPAHGGACLVMPWYAGRPLAELRREMAGPPDEPALRALLASLLSALHAWHGVNGVHGGVHPAGVLLLDDDRPLLLGPNLAERALARGPALHPLEPGFAAPEMASDPASVGPWSDVHALAQLARFAITGLMPPPAGVAAEPLALVVERLLFDVPAARYRPGLLAALDRAASPAIAERPQSIAEFAAWIENGPPRGPSVALATTEIDVELDLAAPPAWPAAEPAAAPTAAASPRPGDGATTQRHAAAPPAAGDAARAGSDDPGGTAPTHGADVTDWSRWPESAPSGSPDIALPDGAADSDPGVAPGWAQAPPHAEHPLRGSEPPAWAPTAASQAQAYPPLPRQQPMPPIPPARGAEPADPREPAPAAGERPLQPDTGTRSQTSERPPQPGATPPQAGAAARAAPQEPAPARAAAAAARARSDAAGERREPPLMPFHLPAGTPTRQDPAAPSRPADTPAAGDDEAPDAATVELIQRVLDAIPPAPPRREPAAGAARDSGFDRAAAAGHDSGFGGPGGGADSALPPRAGNGRWLLVALALAVVAGGAFWWSQERSGAAPSPSRPPVTAPEAPLAPSLSLPAPTATGPAGAGAGAGGASLGDADPAPAGVEAPPPREAFVDPPRDTAPPPAALPPRQGEPAAPIAPASPREVCGERTEFSLYRCMQQQCERGAFARHPQCAEFRATDRVPAP